MCPWVSCDLPTRYARAGVRHWQQTVCQLSARAQNNALINLTSCLSNASSYCAGRYSLPAENTAWRYPCPVFRLCRRPREALWPSPRRAPFEIDGVLTTSGFRLASREAVPSSAVVRNRQAENWKPFCSDTLGAQDPVSSTIVLDSRRYHEGTDGNKRNCTEWEQLVGRTTRKLSSGYQQKIKRETRCRL